MLHHSLCLIEKMSPWRIYRTGYKGSNGITMGLQGGHCINMAKGSLRTGNKGSHGINMVFC